MRIICSFALLAVLMCGSPCLAAGNDLPDDAKQALAQGSSGHIYSLEPWAMPGGPNDRLHDRAVLGDAALDSAETKTVTHVLANAVRGWDGIAVGCFDPRQALRLRAGGATYDFLMSYECHRLQVFKGTQLLADVGAFGDPRDLTDLLTQKGIPVSRSGQAMQPR